jgi:exopolyphosphatase/guanosine-5'-triphosphate,3'-diphosphate pyrophosphatase
LAALREKHGGWKGNDGWKMGTNPKDSMRAGVIDIGSSSVKLTIGEKDGDEMRILESLKSIIPLGTQTFFKQRISQEITNQTIRVLSTFKQSLEEYEVENVSVIATTAVREARNRDIFIDTISRKTGLAIEVLTVGDVIFYIDSYLSRKLKNAYPIYEKNLFVAELGAGSLDVSLMAKGYSLMNTGLPVGTLRLKQVVSELDGSFEEVNIALREHIENEFAYLKRIVPEIDVDDIILIDETYSYHLGDILPEKKFGSNFFKFTRADSEEMLAQVGGRNPEEIAHSYRIPSEIADTVAGYAGIVHLLFTLTPHDYIYILETSLAEAVLASVLFELEVSTRYSRYNQLVSIARNLCRKFQADVRHSEHVAELSQTLFGSLKDHLGLSDEDELYLTLAAYLHDIGSFVHNRAHHKHTEYIVSNLNLFRLTDEEIKTIACIARYHRKAAPVDRHLLYSSLPLDKRILVQKLSALLRIANALDCSHRQKVKKLEVKRRGHADINLVIHTPENVILEKADFQSKRELFQEITGNRISLVVKETH